MSYTTTPNLALKKPTPGTREPVDITLLNGNFDTLDAAVTLTGVQTLTNKTLTSPVVGTKLSFADAVSKIVPGGTSLSLRNNADTIDNLLVTETGDVTVRGTVSLPATVARISSTTAALRLNASTGDLVFERGGGQVGSFRSSDNKFTADLGLVVVAGDATIAAGRLAITNAAASSVGVNGVFQNGKVVLTLANNGTAQIGQVASVDGLVFVRNANGDWACYALKGGANAVTEVFDPAAAFSAAAGTVGQTNIYWSAGNARYEIENKTGGAVTYYCFFVGPTV